MSRSLPNAERYDRFVLTSANLLIETNTRADRHLRIPSQHDRLASHIQAFRWIELELGRRAATHVIGLQELQITDDHHNGEDLLKSMNHSFGLWHPHSRKSSGEHIGAISSRDPDSSEIIPLDNNRYALALRFGQFCVTVAHPIYSDAKRRAKQYDALLEYLEDEPYAALIGDLNEEPLPFSSRRKLGKIGLESAFTRTHQGHPVTLPTPAYKPYRSWPARIGFELLGGGLRYDDIYVSQAMKVDMAGTITADSDHRFVYADIRTPVGIFRQ